MFKMNNNGFTLTFLLLIFIPTIVAASRIATQNNNNYHENDEAIVEQVTPECAVVLLIAGTALSGTTTLQSMAKPILPMLGFAKGTFAAFWESIIQSSATSSSNYPLLLTSLHSIVLNRVSEDVIIHDDIGGFQTAKKIKEICIIIDDVNPNSTEGGILAALLIAAPKVKNVWNHVKDKFRKILLDPHEEIKNMANQWQGFMGFDNTHFQDVRADQDQQKQDMDNLFERTEKRMKRDSDAAFGNNRMEGW